MGVSEHNKVVSGIREKFIARLAGQHERCQQLDRDWQSRADNLESLEELCAIAHKIAGLAKSVGFPDLGAAAFQADSNIRKWLKDDHTMTSEEDVATAIKGFLEHCNLVLSDDSGNDQG